MHCGLFSTYMTALLSGFGKWCTSASLLSPVGNRKEEAHLGRRKRKKMSTETRIEKKTLLELNKYSNQSELIFVLL